MASELSEKIDLIAMSYHLDTGKFPSDAFVSYHIYLMLHQASLLHPLSKEIKIRDDENEKARGRLYGLNTCEGELVLHVVFPESSIPEQIREKTLPAQENTHPLVLARKNWRGKYRDISTYTLSPDSSKASLAQGLAGR